MVRGMRHITSPTLDKIGLLRMVIGRQLVKMKKFLMLMTLKLLDSRKFSTSIGD
jgi:hypothetical protein